MRRVTSAAICELRTALEASPSARRAPSVAMTRFATRTTLSKGRGRKALSSASNAPTSEACTLTCNEPWSRMA